MENRKNRKITPFLGNSDEMEPISSRMAISYGFPGDGRKRDGHKQNAYNWYFEGYPNAPFGVNPQKSNNMKISLCGRLFVTQIYHKQKQRHHDQVETPCFEEKS